MNGSCNLSSSTSLNLRLNGFANIKTFSFGSLISLIIRCLNNNSTSSILSHNKISTTKGTSLHNGILMHFSISRLSTDNSIVGSMIDIGSNSVIASNCHLLGMQSQII